MGTFDRLDKYLGSVPGEISLLLSQIDRAQGREEAFRLQHPQQLDVLVQRARIESTEASNAIEGITAPPARIRALVEQTTKPRNRPEEEIAGYRKVLDLIHSTKPESIPLNAGVVRQLHKQMYEYTSARGGEYKVTDNEVVEILPDGSREVRYKPVAAWQTSAAMENLHEHWTAASESSRYHPLLLAAAYVFDFLMIHPFLDGNGRMSRLLTLLLLYKAGYGVGRFISLEKLIEESKETYYEALQNSTEGWFESEHDLLPWIRYFLGITRAAYGRFEERAGAAAGRGTKSEAVRTFVQQSLSSEFSIGDVRRACPGVSDKLIRKVIAQMQDEGLVSAASRGPTARYRRLI